MDTWTHGLLGAAAAAALAGKGETRKALLVGALAGALADMDIFFRSPADPVGSLLQHRYFTHALLFIPAGALAAAVLSRLLVRGIPFRRAYVFSLVAYSTHALLDCFTSYGTPWFLPFSKVRVAWDYISIIDPAFSAPLFFAACAAYFKAWRGAARAGIAWCVLYLALGGVLHSAAERTLAEAARSRGETVLRMRALPSLGNLLVWRGIVDAGDHYRIDAVRLSVFGNRLYPGASVKPFRPDRDMPLLDRSSVLYRDMARFSYFADGWLYRDPRSPGEIGDLRYAAVPNSTSPLWSIRPGPPGVHAEMVHHHRVRGAQLASFWGMLKGLPEPAPAPVPAPGRGLAPPGGGAFHLK